MRSKDTNAKGADRMADPHVLALTALGWVVSDDRRRDRLLALTGLEGSDLRTRIEDPALLGAVLGFLEAHESDLVNCASAIGSTPEALVAARGSLGS